jgi:hypothetical protein
MDCGDTAVVKRFLTVGEASIILSRSRVIWQVEVEVFVSKSFLRRPSFSATIP